MVRAADSSALYALVVTEDAHHRRALEAFADPEPIVIPTEILIETIDLLQYRFGWTRARAALDDILALPHVSLADKVRIEPVRTLHADAKGKFSLADAFVVQTCRATGAVPLSYDEDIRRLVPG